jgi:hypothetical protein
MTDLPLGVFSRTEQRVLRVIFKAIVDGDGYCVASPRHPCQRLEYQQRNDPQRDRASGRYPPAERDRAGPGPAARWQPNAERPAAAADIYGIASRKLLIRTGPLAFIFSAKLGIRPPVSDGCSSSLIAEAGSVLPHRYRNRPRDCPFSYRMRRLDIPHPCDKQAPTWPPTQSIVGRLFVLGQHDPDR